MEDSSAGEGGGGGGGQEEVEGLEDEEEFQELSLSQTILKYVTIFCLYSISYDPWAIYKGLYKQTSRARYGKFLRPELRLPLNKWDKLRPYYRTFAWIGFGVLAVRFLLICLVQLAKYQETIHSKPDREPTTAKRESQAAKLIGLLKEYNIYYMFGNILSGHTGLSLAIHLVLIISISYMVHVIPYYYTLRPMDSLNLRIGLDPRQELKRVNLAIREKIESRVIEMEEAKIDRHRRQQIDPKLLVSWRNHWNHLGASVGQPAVRFEFHFDPALRPVRYNKVYPSSTWQTSVNLCLMITMSTLLWGGLLELYLYFWSLGLKCDSKGLPDNMCNIWSALDPYEIYSIFELLFIMNLFGFIFGVVATMIAVQLVAQSIIEQEMEADLRDLLNALRLIQNRFNLSYKDIRLIREINANEPYLNDALLKHLVKASVNLDDFRTQAGFISEQATSFMVFYGTALLFSLTLIKLDGPDIRQFLHHTIKYMWTVPNLMLIFCARSYTKLLKLQKIGWSILAVFVRHPADTYHRNRRRNNSNNSCSSSSIRSGGGGGRSSICMEESLVEAWKKLVESEHFIDRKCSIRPFGLSLTYKQVLQINFYFISLAALMFR